MAADKRESVWCLNFYFKHHPAIVRKMGSIAYILKADAVVLPTLVDMHVLTSLAGAQMWTPNGVAIHMGLCLTF